MSELHNLNERERKAIDRFQELTRGKYSAKSTVKILRHHKWDVDLAVPFVFSAEPSEVKRICGEQFPYAVADVARDLERSKDRDKREQRQFGCAPCDQVWWRQVLVRKPVARCFRCRIRYDAIPRENEYGLAEFNCICGQTFSGFGYMPVPTRCLNCQSLCFPSKIFPPSQRSKTRARTGRKHSCRAPNCHNRKPGVYDTDIMCVHPRSNPKKVIFASIPHTSTGSTISSPTSQGSINLSDQPSSSGIVQDFAAQQLPRFQSPSMSPIPSLGESSDSGVWTEQEKVHKLRELTEEFDKAQNMPVVQIFPATISELKLDTIVRFINDDSKKLGVIDIPPQTFQRCRVTTINQGLDSSEENRIQQYLQTAHRNVKCCTKVLSMIDDVIDTCLDDLYQRHSNLQSISSCCFRSMHDGNDIEHEACIVLYCSLKGYLPLGEENFPSEIKGIPTDVREGYAFAPGVQDFNSPLGLGCSVGRLDGEKLGSVGLFTDNPNSRTGFISSAHVFFPYTDLKAYVLSNRKALSTDTSEVLVTQPGKGKEVCGYVTTGWYGDIDVTDPFTGDPICVTVDMAHVELTSRAPRELLINPEIESKHRDETGLIDWPNYYFLDIQLTRDDLERQVYKCGASTSLTKGSIQMAGSTFKKGSFRAPNSPLQMRNQFEIQSCLQAEGQASKYLPTMKPFIDLGDSGSVVFILKENRMHPVALNAGVLFKNLSTIRVPIKSFATPGFAVLEALQSVHPNTVIKNFTRKSWNDTISGNSINHFCFPNQR